MSYQKSVENYVGYMANNAMSLERCTSMSTCFRETSSYFEMISEFRSSDVIVGRGGRANRI